MRLPGRSRSEIMPKPNSEIKFAILKASYWVGDATEYGCVYWLLKPKGKWTEDFEAAHFFDTRSAAELRLAVGDSGY